MPYESSKLRTWLRQAPQPDEVRIRDEQDEVRVIALDENVRNRWKHAEQAVIGARAVVVECLDAKGKILRTLQLKDDEDGEGAAAGKGAALVAPDMQWKGIAAIVDRIAERHNEAFDRGAAAASNSSDSLVGLVEVLTSHLSLAITNLHNVSVNLANAISGRDTSDEPQNGQSSQALQALIAQVAVKAMSTGGADAKNGK
jgi:hypothetical protein